MSGRRALTVCLAALLASSAATAGVVVGVPAGDAPAALGGTDPAAENGSDANVSVTFENQTVYGINITVESVTVPRNGYVLIRNSSDPNGTIIGYQNVYAGTSRNVSVPLYEGPAANQPMEAVTPWATLDVEPNDTETWTATVHLGDYGPSTVDDISTSDTATVTAGQYAEVTFDNKSIEPNAKRITVERAYIPDGGYVYVTGQEGYALTQYLPAGTYRDLSIPLERSGGSGEYTASIVRYITPSMGGFSTKEYYANGSEVNDTAHVTVGEPPTPYPHLQAADDRVLNSSETATLSGVHSGDDSTPFYSLEYQWAQVSGPPVHIANVESSTNEFTAPAVPRNTTLTFRLTATDNDWNTNSTTLDVYVRPVETAEPNASFAVSNLNAPAQAPAAGTMAVSATVTNVGNTTATQTVEYRVDSDGDGTPEPFGVNESVTLTPGENRTVTLNVPTTDLPGGTNAHGVFSAGVGQTAELNAPMDATFYQVDFIAGEPMELSSDTLYADENRLVRWLLGNTQEGITDRGTAWATERVRSCVDAPHIERNGDTASITFTVAENCSDLTLTLVSYSKPSAGFSRETADQQELFDATSGTFGPGEHTLTIPLPTSNETETAESVLGRTP